jgi:hypothetical protein
MKRLIILVTILIMNQRAISQSIDLTHPETSVQTGHLKIGGESPQGTDINANSRYLTLGGKPWFPVMGEFHFSRYPRGSWKDELLKMKAGGMNVVSTYVFWIHHEEIRDQWDWSGNNDLHAFVETCQKCGLLVIVRLGPWAHGECRNGGFPDWLQNECGTNVRRDTEPYLSRVRQFYTQIYAQLRGLRWCDGGPVIGVQLENELTRGADHILTLKKMAREIGFDVPLYTMTGWMTAQVPQGEVLPMFGGYPDAFWAPQITQWDRKARLQYQFTLVRDDATIGIDVAGGHLGASDATARTEPNPYLTCEMGGGMAISYARRPVIDGDDVAALAMVKLGCGSNLMGYYMYHGGANPMGKRSTLQESTATGYPNDMPVINYDFQAPLGQYGQRGPAYDALRGMHLFLHDFGSDLATLPAVLPEKMPADLDDQSTLRWSVRSDGRRGFIFVNNYQRIEALPEKKAVQLQLKLRDGTIKVPSEPIDIPAQTYCFWPFNMDLNGVRLKYATAQPLCRIGETYVFSASAGIESEFVFDPATQSSASSAPTVGRIRIKPGQLIGLKSRTGALLNVLLLSRGQSLQAYKASLWGKERLFLTQCGLIFDADSVRLQSPNPEGNRILIYPAPPALNCKSEAEGIFTGFSPTSMGRSINAEWKRIEPAAPAPELKTDGHGRALVPDDSAFSGADIWHISVPKDALDDAEDSLLQIHYTGDIARAYIGDRLIDDDFYFGRPWEIGLRRFAPEVLEKGITLKILPLRKDAPIYIPKDRLPRFGADGQAVGVSRVDIVREYEVALHPAAQN